MKDSLKSRKKAIRFDLSLLLILCLLIPAVLSGCSKNPNSGNQAGNGTQGYGSVIKAEIEVVIDNKVEKAEGTIKVDLYPDVAPETVQNFCALAKDGFYDGLTFHRVINGFMIQGGDPQGNGLGGSDKNIVGEFSANGHENPIPHERGTISMARAKDYNSASSQFFICQEQASHLDGSYAAFGTVTEGMELVDKICDTTPVRDTNGTVARKDQPVIRKITIVE